MRRIVMFNQVTADGYFAGPDGNLDWVVPDEEITTAGAAATAGTDTILFGRRTYELFEGFWPHALDDSKSTRLDLLEAKGYQSGNVMLRYAPRTV